MHFFEKKSAKSLPVQKLLVPLQPQISREAFAQMAESVDALVSNTSGAIHPGSIPGLGTKSCKSKDLRLFFIPLISQIYTDLSFGVENICVICEICGTFLFISTITLETFILFHDGITSQLL